MNLPQNFNQLKFKGFKWHAACCVVIVEEKLFFILRSRTMPTHPGQIAFIGGGNKDEETPLETAYREFKEETSFDFEGDFLGYLKPVWTSGMKCLIPVCLKSNLSIDDFSSRLSSNGEWDDSFFIGIDDLARSSKWSFGNFHFAQNQQKEVYFFSTSHIIPSTDTLLWGASASIVVDFTSRFQAR